MGRMEVRCFVSYPVRDSWTEPALVSLETAAYLRARGWWGVDLQR